MPGYVYKARDAADVQARATQDSGMFDRFFRGDHKMFKAREGLNQIRVLPPTWENARHYGLDVYLHYNIGPDNGTYVCLAKWNGEPCPVCEALAEAQRHGNEEAAKKLRATKKIVAWVIDRNDENAGPQLFGLGYKMDRDIARRSIDRRTGRAIMLDHPQEGFDVFFTRVGSGIKTTYEGIEIDREPTPIHDDPKQAERWLQVVVENPIPKIVRTYDYNYLKKLLAGAPVRDPEEDDDKGSEITVDGDRKEAAPKTRTRLPPSQRGGAAAPAAPPSAPVDPAPEEQAELGWGEDPSAGSESEIVVEKTDTPADDAPAPEPAAKDEWGGW